MITGSKEHLDQYLKTHQCPEHGRKLCVAWHEGEDSYVIRCSEGHFPEELVRELTPLEDHKAGKVEAHTPLTSLLPRTDLQTGELLVPEVVKALMDYAYKYTLDPYRGHVVMMYSKPYITIDGYLYYANRSQQPYQLKSRPLTPDERLSYQVVDNDHAWISEIIMEREQRSFVGFGIVTQEEMAAKSKSKPEQLRSPVVAKHPWQLAQKRAEWQALRRAFPIGETKEASSEAGDKSSVS